MGQIYFPFPKTVFGRKRLYLIRAQEPSMVALLWGLVVPRVAIEVAIIKGAVQYLNDVESAWRCYIEASLVTD